MASQVSHFPHIKNVKVARERWDPMHSSMFLISFVVPAMMKGEFNEDELQILSQQVISVSGLDNLQKPLTTFQQKYLGVTKTYVVPYLDNTSVDFSITFNLNIRDYSDAYVVKLFKQWMNIIYSMSTGVYSLNAQHTADMTILEANRDGTVWRQLILKDCFPTNITGLDSLDYSVSDPRQLTVSFHSDYWDETLG